MMKLTATVASVWQLTSKPLDLAKPLRVAWTVKLFTHPHVADIELSSDALADGSVEYMAFVAWASNLACNDKVEIDLGGKQ